MTVWQYISEYFNKEENWGNYLKINGMLLLVLYALRQYTRWPIIIHCAYEYAGHLATGYHPRGEAVDFHFDTDTPYCVQVDKVLEFLLQFQISDKVGLGIYPAWNNPGFHLDIRGSYARWGWTGQYDEEGNKVYVAFNKALEYARQK